MWDTERCEIQKDEEGGVTLKKGIRRACQKSSAIELEGENRRSESADLI